jgi:peptidoglycan/LPS O-acetylase OafA/YrhL
MPDLPSRDRFPQKLLRPVMPELDSLRGIAILLVLFFHGFDFGWGSALLPSAARAFVNLTLTGWIGVNLFFVLSGFLITGILVDSKRRLHYYKPFYIRRALRILPAYYGVLLLLWVLPGTGLLWHRRVGWPFLALSVVYLSNIVSLLGVRPQYAVLWSLAVEEQFYIFWPAVVRVFSRQRLIWCALLVIIGCPALRAAAYGLGYSYGAPYPWLVADGLACGALLALLSRGPLAERKEMRVFSILSLCLGGGLLIAGIPFGILRSSTLSGAAFRLTGLNVFFTGVVGSALLIGTSRFHWLVQRPLLQFFGKISYGLYLIHMLAFDFVDQLIARYFPSQMAILPGRFDLLLGRFATAAGISVVLAFLSRRYFEEPFLRLKDRWSRSSSDSSRGQGPAANEAGVEVESMGPTV